MRVLCDKCDKVCNLKRAIKSNKFVCWSCKNDKEKVLPMSFNYYKLFPKSCNYYELFPKNEWSVIRVINEIKGVI
jgi:hypothetical protein